MIQPFTHGTEMTLCDVEVPDPTRIVGIIWTDGLPAGQGCSLETVVAIARARAVDLELDGVVDHLDAALAELGVEVNGG